MKKITTLLFTITLALFAFNNLNAASVGVNNEVSGYDIKPTPERPFPPSMLRTKNNH